jgi:hypothetical protein
LVEGFRLERSSRPFSGLSALPYPYPCPYPDPLLVPGWAYIGHRPSLPFEPEPFIRASSSFFSKALCAGVLYVPVPAPPLTELASPSFELAAEPYAAVADDDEDEYKGEASPGETWARGRPGAEYEVVCRYAADERVGRALLLYVDWV